MEKGLNGSDFLKLITTISRDGLRNDMSVVCVVGDEMTSNARVVHLTLLEA